jgi:hypothetical protein
MIQVVNPDYKYAKKVYLASSIVEGALHQHFFKGPFKNNYKL